MHDAVWDSLRWDVVLADGAMEALLRWWRTRSAGFADVELPTRFLLTEVRRG